MLMARFSIVVAVAAFAGCSRSKQDAGQASETDKVPREDLAAATAERVIGKWEMEGDDKDVGPLTQLIPPAILTGSPITGKGNDRKAEVVVKSTSDRSIASTVVQVLFLREDGSVSKRVPHTQTVYTLARGESYTVKVDSAYMDDDMTAVDGLLSEITFDDESTWPPMPATPPKRNGDDPVAIKMIGYQGSGERSSAVVACFNHGSKTVASVGYRIRYFDAKGKELKATRYAHSGNKENPLLESGAGKVLIVGKGPPKGATDARASVSSVTFTDGSQWKAAE